MKDSAADKKESRRGPHSSRAPASRPSGQGRPPPSSRAPVSLRSPGIAVVSYDDDDDDLPPSVIHNLPSFAAPGAIQFVCTECWRTFTDGSRAACDCERPRPAQGWTAMPYLFRNRYLFVELLGRGGMGAVFRAYDQAAGNESPWVAVKVVQQSNPETAALLKEMFRKEVSAAQMLSQHKTSFVQVLGHDNVDPAYLVTEHVPWQTLEQLRNTLPGSVEWLPPIQVARIGTALLRGVAKMHFHRIVHRDITPSNVFIQRSSEGDGYDVKITDLGIWALDQVQGDSESLTMVGRKPSIDGTPNYMSPEQSKGEGVGAQSDLHTVGSLLWELATGEVPFPARNDVTPSEAVEQRFQTLKQLPKRPAGMPEGLYKVLSKALAFEPAKRFPSAVEMRRGLEGFVSQYGKERQRELESSWESIDKMSAQVAGLREKLLPMRGLLERLVSVGAVLREVRDHREEAEPDAVRTIAETARKQLEEIRTELSALSAWLEFVAEQGSRISLPSPPPGTKDQGKSASNDEGAGVAAKPNYAKGAKARPPLRSSLLPQPSESGTFNQKPWVYAAVGALLLLVLLLGYWMGRPGAEAANAIASPESRPAPTPAPTITGTAAAKSPAADEPPAPAPVTVADSTADPAETAADPAPSSSAGSKKKKKAKTTSAPASTATTEDPSGRPLSPQNPYE